MNNKTIAKLLKNAVESSKCKQEVWGKMNGFDVITRYKTVVDGDKLKLGVETIIAMLENVEESEG